MSGEKEKKKIELRIVRTIRRTDNGNERMNRREREEINTECSRKILIEVFLNFHGCVYKTT